MFFYLQWIDRRPSTISILKNEPDNYNFKGSFNINKCKYTICGNISDKLIEYYPSPKKKYTKNQYLQSHLQKSIRRKDTFKSIKTAKHLIDLDLITFLRRLPIIMLEDVVIHESISVIVWLMIAINKGFRIRCDMVKWLLGVVYYLSNENHKQEYLTENIQDSIINEKHINKDILLPLRFRKCYGGMKGDMNMIEYYILNIISDNIIIHKDKINIIKLEMEPLMKNEWIYQANDFHCNKSIINQIKVYHKKYDEERIKSLIWLFSSSINYREDSIKYHKKDLKDWVEIKKTVKAIQKKCVFY